MAVSDAAGREHDERPWGTYTVLEDATAEGFKVKRLTVHPGHRLSYQRHAQRAEHWFVVAGTATVTLDDVQQDVPAGSAIDIRVGTAHRVENRGSEPLTFVEVQQGAYLGEDDIVRLDDDYGRAPHRLAPPPPPPQRMFCESGRRAATFAGYFSKRLRACVPSPRRACCS